MPDASCPATCAANEHAPLRGVLLLVLAMLLIPFNDAIAKILTARYPVAEIVWGRYIVHLLLLAPFVLLRYGPRAFWPEQTGLQVLRGALMVGATFFFFWALSRLPMANTVALIFFYPMVVTALSPLILKEHVGLRRWIAVFFGLIGTLIIVRPGTDVFQWWSLIALCGGSCYALFLIVTRKVAGSAPPLVTAGYAAVVGAVAMPLIMPGGWVVPNLADLGLFVAMGGVAAIAHVLIAKAVDYAPASLLAGFGYTEIVMATVLGYVIFGDFPDAWTWVGVVVIIAAGLYITMRERRVHGDPTVGTPGAPAD